VNRPFQCNKRSQLLTQIRPTNRERILATFRIYLASPNAARFPEIALESFLIAER
jgi:hypothetical protein